MIYNRLLAFLVDLFIIVFPGALIIIINDLLFDNQQELLSKIIAISSFIVLILKDVFFVNKSLAKVFFNLEIIDLKSLNKVGKGKLIIRNLTLIIWPLEVILLLTLGKRLGDMILGTTVIKRS